MVRRIKRALILGGNGFLGSALAEHLGASGEIEAIRVDRRHHGVTGRLTVDVLSADLAGIFERIAPDVVFHFATTSFVPPSLDDPFGDLVSNAGSTVRVLDAARRLERPPLVVIASSAAVYGDGQFFPMREDHPLTPKSPYGAAKLASEQYADLFHRMYGLSTLSVRPFSLYGPGQRKQVIHDLTRRLLEEGTVHVDADPTVERDFVFVRDAADMITTLARRAPAQGEAYNVCSGTSESIGQVADLLCAAVGDVSVEFSGRTRPGDPRRWCGDPAAAAALGAMASTGLSDGLAETVDWLRGAHG